MQNCFQPIYFMLKLVLISHFLVDSSVNCLYSTKTAYYDSFTDDQLSFINNIENYKIKNCEPEQIYILLRHGSRYPSTKQVDKSKKFLDSVNELRQKQTNFDKLTDLDEIKLSFENEPHYRLSELGANEMKEIAKRFKLRYPNLFNESELLNSTESVRALMNIISSDRDRSIQSAHNFLKGLYEQPNHADTEFGFNENAFKLLEYLSQRIDVNNRMMRLFDDCENYLNNIKNNEQAHIELTKFKKGREVVQLINNLKKRNNIEELELTPSILVKLFTLCNIESAHRMPDNWCKLFKQEDYEVMSYLNDLKGYWMKSYGNEINSQVISLLIQDMFTEMERHITNDPKKHKVLLRFGHAENIFPMVTALGLFNDENKLRADNFNENLNRKFKSAILTPFSSNIAFVLNRCNSTDPNEAKNQADDIYAPFKITILINEMPLSKINAGDLKCAGTSEHSSSCKYADFKQHLSKYLYADLDQICLKKTGMELNDVLNDETLSKMAKIKIDL